MSVYVDRLPDSCYRCVCKDECLGVWRCSINGESIAHEGRREDCPLKEIIHCKDCKWNETCCRNIRPEGRRQDDYCSYGEKVQLSSETSTKTSTNGTYIRDGRLMHDLVYRGEAEVDIPTNTPTNTSTDLISRQAAIKTFIKWGKKEFGYSDINREERFIDAINALPLGEDMGEVSDGYHTFNQLYHQRAVLFATIVNQNKDKAWKSWKHEDGQFCFDKGGEWFVVGVDTPEGSYTYHYEQKYWELFDCEELDRGKHWDGHTEEDVTRLLSLPPVEPVAKNTTTTELETDDENELKFYYVESLDDYWVGRRLDNFYYATWHGRLGFIWSHSKYLPWGEHIVDENTLWKEHTYPSEPVEIPFTEWIVGFVKKYFAEPKPVCEDAISRKWVLNEIITKVEDDDSLTDEQRGSLSVAKYIIRHAPPAEPERPRGEWVEVEDYNGDVHYKCDQCGEEWTFTYGTPKENNANFCPNCGADMRGDTE